MASIVGTVGNNQLEGTRGVDVIVGLGGDDRIRGHGGKDLICGGDGSDIVHGGSGADRLLGGQGSDWLRGKTGDDRIDGGLGKDLVNPGEGHNRAWGGAGNDSIQLGKFVNRSSGGHHDVVYGGPGNDHLNHMTVDDGYGGRGGDTLWVESYKPGTSQVLDGGLGPNRLIFVGFRRNSGVRWNQVTIDLAHDRIGADGVTSSLAGTFHWLRLYSFAAHHWTVNGTGADDTLYARFAGDSVTLLGRAGDDELTGTGGDDVLGGGSGTDVLHGRDGDDIVRGGVDADQGDGGPGTDTCVSIEAPTPAHSTTRCEL